MPLTLEQINVALCAKVISVSYEIRLPVSYAHDVAHTCVSIALRKEDDKPFLVGYRDSGCEYAENYEALEMRDRILGKCRWYAFAVNHHERRVDAKEVSEFTPYQFQNYFEGRFDPFEEVRHRM